MSQGNEAARPKTRLAALTAGASAGLGALFVGGGKAAGASAAKGGAAKAFGAGATSADAAEAAAVFVAGGAVGQTGTTIIKKNSRVRKIRITPKGELPLAAQLVVATTPIFGLAFFIIGLLANL